MVICFLASTNSIHTYRWVKYFAEKGHKISVISLKEPTFDYEGIEVYVLKRITSRKGFISHLINFLPFVYQIVKLKRQIQPNVFHALGSSNGLLASASNCEPLIFTIADPDLHSFLNKYPIKKANLLVVDGQNTKQAMIGLGADIDKIKMIRYGVDLNKFKPDKFCRNQKVVISTKPLRKESDVATLIKAIPIIIKEIPKVRFLIVGDGDQEENLIKLAKLLKVYNTINFAGDISSDKIVSYLNSADIFVNPSFTDTGLAASTTEAMACELPVLVSDVGDNKLWIDNKFIFPAGDYKALAEKIIYVFNQDILRTYDNNIIERHFNYHKEMKKMLEIYLGFSSLEHPHRPMLIKKIKEYSPDSILELGCGYGPNLILLRKEMPNVKGIDIDEMAIVKGRELGLLPKEISTGEAENLSGYKDNSIDVVFSDAVLMYVKDIKKVIQEMLRISKKGLILVEWHAEEDNYNSHIGNWTRNYRKILEQFVSPEQIEITKITKEEWPNKDWIKNGYLINVTL